MGWRKGVEIEVDLSYVQVMQIKNYIHNEFVGAQNGGALDYYDPCTGQVMGQQPDSDKLDAVKAVTTAQKAFPEHVRVDDEGDAFRHFIYSAMLMAGSW